MKALKVISAVIVSTMVLSACGSSKEVPKSQSVIVQEVFQELDACEKYAMKKPETRAVGEAYDYRISNAKTYAEGQARAEFRRKIMASITAASSEDAAGYEKYGSSGNDGVSVRDEDAKKNLFVTQIADGIVKNTAIVEMTKYLRADGSYHVYVCIEYLGGIDKMAENIAKQYEQNVSDEERLKMNFEFEKFRERIKAEMAKQK